MCGRLASIARYSSWSRRISLSPIVCRSTAPPSTTDNRGGSSRSSTCWRAIRSLIQRLICSSLAESLGLATRTRPGRTTAEGELRNGAQPQPRLVNCHHDNQQPGRRSREETLADLRAFAAGPNAWVPEPIGTAGVLTTLLEAITVASALWFLLPRKQRAILYPGSYRFALGRYRPGRRPAHGTRNGRRFRSRPRKPRTREAGPLPERPNTGSASGKHAAFPAGVYPTVAALPGVHWRRWRPR